MIFKAWCRHHLGGPYATIVATAMLNLIIIIILGEVRDISHGMVHLALMSMAFLTPVLYF